MDTLEAMRRNKLVFIHLKLTMHTAQRYSRLLSILGLSLIGAASLEAAPVFTQQPQGGYVLQTQNYSLSFSANVTGDASWEYEGDSLRTVLLASGGGKGTEIDNGVLTGTSSADNVGATQGTKPAFRIRVTDETGSTLSEPFTVTVISSFFTVASENLGNGYFQQSVLGLCYAGNPPFVYNGDWLGWFALDNATRIDGWMYLLGTRFGWVYYSPFAFPWMYSAGEDSWIYIEFIEGVRWIYIQKTDEWVAAPIG
ncbi:MAG: hypothetical protein ACQKBW_11365 [Puniceicoccales bacterium]